MSLIKVGQEAQNDNLAQRTQEKKKRIVEYFQPDAILFIAICGIHVEKVTYTAEKQITMGRINFIWD